MPTPSKHAPRWPWLLLAPLLAFLAFLQGQLEIDLGNESMKSATSREALSAHRLAERFGGENALALAYFARTHGAVAESEHEAITMMARRMRSERDVLAVDGPIDTDDDLSVVSLQLRPGADAEALLHLARTLCPPTLRLLLAGAPLAEAAIARGVAADRARLLPAIGAALLLLALAFYRSLAHALAALLPAIAAIVTIGAVQQLVGERLDPIGVLLEPVLLTVGVAAAIHYLAAFRRERALGHAPAAALLRTRVAMLWPMTLATATTMLGFWSLALHPIPAVAAFGCHAGLGTGLVHLLTLVLLPRWLASFPGAVPARDLPRLVASRCYVAWLVRRRGVLLLLIGTLGITAVHGWSTLRVDNDPLAVLPASDPFRRDYAEFCSRLGGAETFALLVDAGSPAATAQQLVPFVAAIADRPPAAGLGGAPRLGVDGTVMVPIRLQPSGSAARCELFAAVTDRAAQLGWTGVEVAGLAVQIARDSDRLVQGQLLGMTVTTLGLLLGLAIGLRSLRLALLGILPNVLPCALLYGGLAWCGQPLTVANAMIGSVMLGLIVDNTIHLLHRYQHGRGAPARRVASALATVGRPMVVASIVLSAGFGVGLIGTMATTQDFALLATVTIGLALLGDGLVLPVLLLARAARGATA